MVAALTTATSTLGVDLLAAAGLGLAIAVPVYGIKRGWAVFKSLK